MYICKILNNIHPTPTLNQNHNIQTNCILTSIIWSSSTNFLMKFWNKTELLQWIWFITSLCKTYEEKLQGLLQDALSYLSLSTPVEESKSSQPEAFDRLSDSDALYVHIQTSCKACLEE